MPSSILVQYNVPRFTVGAAGSQNRSCTGDMNVTPGLTQPFEFIFGNSDGVPINLSGYKLRLVFWYPQNEYELLPANFGNNIILAKDLTVDDPYCGNGAVVLTDQETTTLGAGGRQLIRWSLYMIDGDTGSVYGTQVTQSGLQWGVCRLDRSEVPTAEIIKGVTLST